MLREDESIHLKLNLITYNEKHCREKEKVKNDYCQICDETFTQKASFIRNLSNV